MPRPADLLLDPWAGLSHKAAIGDPSGVSSGPVPAWVGKSNRRRLTAYLILAAYLHNAARYWLRPSVEDPDRWKQHREYGDPAMMRSTIRAAVLGGDPRPLVDGSDEELGPPPTIDDVRGEIAADPDADPEDDTAGDGEIEEALAAARAEHDEDRARIEAAQHRQEWADQWWTDERSAMKVVEAEDDAVGLGDGVYELVTSTEKERVRLRVHEPGFYFPVWADDAQGDDFPDKIHFGWVWEDDDTGDEFLRRITYERRRIMQLDDSGEPTGETTTRRYAYAPDVDSQWTVVKTDATWRIKDIRQRNWGVNSLDLSQADIAVNEDGEPILDLDLEQDFIPVVHIPNTPAIKDLWGESALTRVAQILDDLAANDTDMAVSSALVASPAIAISGSAAAGPGQTITTYGPGQVFRTGDGTMSVLDTSKSLDALIKMQERLLERLSAVRQVPQSVLGRVDLGGNLAGITLLLSFGPFRQYISDLRLVRADKYALLLKFVQRMAIVGGWLDGPVLDANLAFGPFLPTDQSAVVALIVQLINAKVISRSTGMRLAQEAGIDIDSIEAELIAVRHEDFDGAVQLANATGSEEAAADYLGVEIDTVTPQAPPGDGSGAPGVPPTLPGDVPGEDDEGASDQPPIPPAG